MPPQLQHLRSDVPHKRPDPALLADGQMAQNRAIESPGAFYKDAAGGLIKVGPTHIGAAAPNIAPAGVAGNSVGESWLDTSATPAILKFWDGVQWIEVGANVDGGASVTTDVNPPLAPADGDLWWRTDIGQLFVWYDDGTSAQWVEANTGGGGGASGDFVPLDSATGAAYMPTGTDAQRPAAPVVGMQRYSATSQFEEVYTGAANGWRKLAYEPAPEVLPADFTVSANTTRSGLVVCNNFTINSGVTLTVDGYGLEVFCYGTATINGTITAVGSGAASFGIGTPSYNSGQGVVIYNDPFSGFSGPGTAANKTYLPIFYLGGTAGARGYVRLDAQAAPASVVADAPGAGGGYIAIRAKGAITMSSTARLLADATSAGGYPNATGNVQACGMSGGSGGAIILHSDVSVTTAGTISAKGGAGGPSGCGGAGCSSGLGGGAGGGGGTVILQAPALTQGTTPALTGGAGGVGYDGAGAGLQLGGGIGMASGGRGGVAGTGGGSCNGNPGSAGIVLTSGSPF